MDPSAQQICQLLDWDTKFFGKRIARITVPALTGGIGAAALEWCRQKKISCLYYLASCGDIRSIRLAEEFSFHLVDIRMTFDISINHTSAQDVLPQIRPAQENDIPALKEIARLAYQHTRFFNDGNFPIQICEELYMTWIEKSCKGYAQSVWVAYPAGDLAGFITCHVENGAGQIGLLGIHPEFHHQGWGNKLVLSALEWFASRNCALVKVVTQGNNVAAQKLYEHCGFSLTSVDLWYHRWFDTIQ